MKTKQINKKEGNETLTIVIELKILPPFQNKTVIPLHTSHFAAEEIIVNQVT